MINLPDASRGGKVREMKVMTVVGTRPEIIRLSRVMAALTESGKRTGAQKTLALKEVCDALEIAVPKNWREFPEDKLPEALRFLTGESDGDQDGVWDDQ